MSLPFFLRGLACFLRPYLPVSAMFSFQWTDQSRWNKCARTLDVPLVSRRLNVSCHFCVFNKLHKKMHTFWLNCLQHTTNTFGTTLNYILSIVILCCTSDHSQGGWGWITGDWWQGTPLSQSAVLSTKKIVPLIISQISGTIPCYYANLIYV